MKKKYKITPFDIFIIKQKLTFFIAKGTSFFIYDSMLPSVVQQNR